MNDRAEQLNHSPTEARARYCSVSSPSDLEMRDFSRFVLLHCEPNPKELSNILNSCFLLEDLLNHELSLLRNGQPSFQNAQKAVRPIHFADLHLLANI